MHPLLLDFEPLADVTNGSHFVVRWRLDGPTEGTMKVMIAPVQQGCPSIKRVLGTDIDIHAKDIRIPPISIDPGLYIIEAVNQTNQAHILATSHSFHVFPSPTERDGTNLMGAFSRMSGTTPPPSCTCDNASLTGKLGVVIGTVLAIGLPCLIVLSFILWKLYRPPPRPKNLPQVITPFRHLPSPSSTDSPSGSLKSKSSYNSLDRSWAVPSWTAPSWTASSSSAPTTIRPPSLARFPTSSLICQGYTYSPSSCCLPLWSTYPGATRANGHDPPSRRCSSTSAGQGISSPPPPEYSPC